LGLPSSLWRHKAVPSCSTSAETSALPEAIRISDTVQLPLSELAISYIRSPGPGGQNVYKVATAAQLRFDLQGSPSIPAAVKARAARLAGSRLTTEGVIVITASTFRSQPQNESDAVDRLVALLKKAAIAPKRRVATRPTLGSKLRRLASKTKRAELKRGRRDDPAAD